MRPSGMIEMGAQDIRVRPIASCDSPRDSNQQIPRELGTLVAEICTAEELTKHLLDRLTPVIRPIPLGHNREAEERESLAPLAGNLRDLREQLAAVNETLRFALETIQV